ncbi:MAG: hypothetical protein JW889_13070 [Verrucomicrobia bacterium]|nr:hypothetical protein [Verrucomicrobiota bacterium]
MAAFGCLAVAGPSSAAECPQFESGERVGTVAHGAIKEASGIVASRHNLNVLWVHNDSGDSARVLAMNTQGTHLGIYTITGAGAVDWEDIAIGPGPAAGSGPAGSGPAGNYLYLGDIGDNNAVRTGGVCVYRVPEPAVDAHQDPVSVAVTGAVAITLRYPDGPRDAETLMVDPANGDIYIVSKREAKSRVYRDAKSRVYRDAKSRVYRAAYPQTSGMTMELVAELPWGGATGGEISPRRTELIIRGYLKASLWRIPDEGTVADAFDEAPCGVPVALEPQGEAVAFDAFGFGYFTLSEGARRPIYYFARVADAPSLAISYIPPDTYRLTWPEPGFFNLEFDTSSAFDDPNVVDVTGLTQYDYTTTERRGVFRLVRTGY